MNHFISDHISFAHRDVEKFLDNERLNNNVTA